MMRETKSTPGHIVHQHAMFNDWICELLVICLIAIPMHLTKHFSCQIEIITTANYNSEEVSVT
jgi:hypothetical protein